MNHPHAQPQAQFPTAVSPEPQDAPEADTRLHGQRLVMVRVAWVALVVPTLAVFVASLLAEGVQLQTVCLSTVCASGQLTPSTVRTLQELGLSVGGYATFSLALAIISALVWFAVGGVLVWRKSDDWMALFVALMLIMQGTLAAVDTVAGSSSAWQFPAVLLNFLAFVALFLAFCLFPDGRFLPRWTYWLVVVFIAVALSYNFFSRWFPTVSPWPFLLSLTWIGLVVSLAVAQIYRYRRVSGAVQRQQTKWVVFGVTTFVVVSIGLNLPEFLVPSLVQPSSLYSLALLPARTMLSLLIPLSIGIAILRYRLWDIDLIINRMLVYGALTCSIIGIYVLIVGYFSIGFQLQGNPIVSLLATGVVAMLFQPLRVRLQRGVNRLMFGERGDPYAVLSRLGQRLEATFVPEEVLPAIVETLAHSLKLPYVAIRLKQDDAFTLATSYGVPREKVLRLPLIYQTETIGELVLGFRAAGESFTKSEHQLLSELARQAGIAVHGVLLTTDFRACPSSRNRCAWCTPHYRP